MGISAEISPGIPAAISAEKRTETLQGIQAGFLSEINLEFYEAIWLAFPVEFLEDFLEIFLGKLLEELHDEFLKGLPKEFLEESV